MGICPGERTLLSRQDEVRSMWICIYPPWPPWEWDASVAWTPLICHSGGAAPVWSSVFWLIFTCFNFGHLRGSGLLVHSNLVTPLKSKDKASFVGTSLNPGWSSASSLWTCYSRWPYLLDSFMDGGFLLHEVWLFLSRTALSVVEGNIDSLLPLAHAVSLLISPHFSANLFGSSEPLHVQPFQFFSLHDLSLAFILSLSHHQTAQLLYEYYSFPGSIFSSSCTFSPPASDSLEQLCSWHQTTSSLTELPKTQLFCANMQHSLLPAPLKTSSTSDSFDNLWHYPKISSL